MTKSIWMIGMSALAVGFGLLATPAVTRAQDSIFVTSTGNVGLGTSTPAVRLDVKCNAAGAVCGRISNSSATGFSGWEFTEEGGTVAANFSVDNANNIFRLNSTNSFPIVILTNSVERMRVTSDGKVGIGTASPGSALDIVANAANTESARITNVHSTGYPGFSYFGVGGAIGLFIGLDNANGNTRINSVNNNPIVMLTNSTEHVRLATNGDVGINCNNPTSNLVIASGGGCSTPSSSINAGSAQFTVSSSRTFKENLSPVQVPGILDKIAKVDVFTYDFIQGPKDRLGLMAEDFHEIFGRGSDKMIDGQEVEMALWLAVKELSAQNQQLIKRLTELEANLEAERTNRQ